VPVTRQNLIAGAQIFIDGLRLRRRFDDDEIALSAPRQFFFRFRVGRDAGAFFAGAFARGFAAGLRGAFGFGSSDASVVVFLRGTLVFP
jgi:hypothetical protein